jgi:hypothetical protein
LGGSPSFHCIYPVHPGLQGGHGKADEYPLMICRAANAVLTS